MPELLFNPSDIGIKEMGISEAIVNSVESCFIFVKGDVMCPKIDVNYKIRTTRSKMFTKLFNERLLALGKAWILP